MNDWPGRNPSGPGSPPEIKNAGHGLLGWKSTAVTFGCVTDGDDGSDSGIDLDDSGGFVFVWVLSADVGFGAGDVSLAR